MNKGTHKARQKWIARGVARFLGVVALVGALVGCQAARESPPTEKSVAAARDQPNTPAREVIDQ